MRKWIGLIAFWLIVTPLLLEVLIRAAVPVLPPALQLAAERVYKGESLDINRIGLMTTDGEHNFVMQPDIENALYGPHQSVVFHVSTMPINESRMGFRSGSEAEPVSFGDDVDVVVVGDSFSFCFTEYDDCWVTQFEQQTGLKTVNLGQGSTGSVSHWRFVDTFARQFRPPLVIWQWFVNDFNEDYQLAVTRGEIPPSDVTTQIPEYQKDTNPVILWLRQNSIAWVVLETAIVGEEPYISDFERYHFTRPYEVSYTGEGGETHLLRFGQNYEQIATNMDDPRISSGVPMTREALENAQDAVDSWGGELVVFLIPTREEVYSDLTAPLMGTEVVEKLGDTRRVQMEMCDEIGLTCLDMLPVFQEYAARGEHLYYTEDMHLNPNGNHILADEIIEWLNELDLLPEGSDE